MTTTPSANLFKHRYDPEKNTSLCDTASALIMMTDRTIATLTMLGCQFDGQVDRLNDELTANVIFAAINEVEDIRATVLAYRDASKKAADVPGVGGAI